MIVPEVTPYEDQAIDIVVNVLNGAKQKLGIRQTLRQLARSRNVLATQAKLTLSSLGPPIAVSSERFILDTIVWKWSLNKIFKYHIKYLGTSKDECSQFYYHEVIFSQPTARYPIPQATASVFFRIADRHIDAVKDKADPIMTFRIEGQRTDHDVRFVTLVPDWILAVIQMKIKLFRRIESLTVF